MPARLSIAFTLRCPKGPDRRHAFATADTWDTEDLGGAGHLYGAEFNVNNDERKAIWLALRHTQYPVDLITDEDVAEGRLSGYRVLYIVGAEMLAAAAEPLQEWIRNGGVLYASGGGGLLDQYHRPLTALHAVYGLKGHTLARAVRHIRPRDTLPAAKPLDVVIVQSPELGPAEIEIPALCYRDAIDAAAGAKVVGKYRSDGSTAVLRNEFGKGTVYYSGVLAGLAYLYAGHHRLGRRSAPRFSGQSAEGCDSSRDAREDLFARRHFRRIGRGAISRRRQWGDCRVDQLASDARRKAGCAVSSRTIRFEIFRVYVPPATFEELLMRKRRANYRCAWLTAFHRWSCHWM